MDHSTVREMLETAAVEAGGLDRLIAGDTPDAAAIAGHLAGCPSCTEEFSRLRRSSAILRDAISTQLPDHLRGRTLAFVAAVGRPRGERAMATAGSEPTPTAGAAQPAPLRAMPDRRRARGPLGWLAATAALVLISVGLTAYTVGVSHDAEARQASTEIAGLSAVASWTVRIDAQPDAKLVVLAASAPGTSDGAVGMLLFSAQTREMVVVADGIAAPPAGHEYGCWVEVAGARQRLGRMYVKGDLAYWVGTVDTLATVIPGSVFGVSLIDLVNPPAPSQPILSGTLQST
jgi:hypothetical protein